MELCTLLCCWECDHLETFGDYSPVRCSGDEDHRASVGKKWYSWCGVSPRYWRQVHWRGYHGEQGCRFGSAPQPVSPGFRLTTWFQYHSPAASALVASLEKLFSLVSERFCLSLAETMVRTIQISPYPSHLYVLPQPPLSCPMPT